MKNHALTILRVYFGISHPKRRRLTRPMPRMSRRRGRVKLDGLVVYPLQVSDRRTVTRRMHHVG